LLVAGAGLLLLAYAAFYVKSRAIVTP
jgi:hypothetical protein